MVEIANPARVGARPRIIFCTSLTQSRLNVHIVREIVSVLERQFEVEFLPVKVLVERDTLSDCAILLYVGSSLSEDVPLATMSAMARIAGVPCVFWATDDPYEHDARYRANDFDVYFSNDLNSTDHYLERANVFHLPLAAPASDYRPLSPLGERRVGMFFCGYPYSCRKRVISDLLAVPRFSCNELVVMGGEWEVPNLQHLAGDSDHSKVIDLYSAVQFVLNIGRNYDLANDHRKLIATTPGPRTFECALAGTPQIFFVNSLEIEKYYTPDREIILAEGVEEAVERFNWFRDHPDAWSALARAAQVRTQKEHLYEHRIVDLLNVLLGIGVLNRSEIPTFYNSGDRESKLLRFA
ncbi:CgeB family protein [Methylorubrum extorquens]|uniref:CgeB family protein n=1 Tax=Methylorubrum extorquens TaxID=408 RepID=UPI000162986A|nr:glycosyltransferase [Methylorubrum extorquens]ABY32059.1 conserved hypothetical proteinn [Methylorubrum extorquens PA1]WIU38668.1 glycosyltransferase [Methylorubrum extorquens]